MIQNPVIPTRKSPPLIRIVGLTGIPCPNYGNQTRIPANPVQVATLRSSSSCSLNSAKELSRSAIGFRQLGYDLFRVSAVSNGGSDGSTGGYGGGSGDGSFGGDGGGGDADGGERKWSLLSWYLTLLEKYPVLTKAVTSAILAFVGDLTCQLAIEQVPSLNLKRIFLFSFLGLVLVGPTLHLWYLYLSKLVTMPGASGALLRLVVDQFLFAPAFIGLFLSTLVTLEGRPSQVMPKLEQEWLSSVLTNWQLWIPFQFLNFRFVPQQFQVLAANFIALVWNVILSYKAHNEVITK